MMRGQTYKGTFSLFKKTPILVVLLLLGLCVAPSTYHFVRGEQINTQPYEDCYGFIIPLSSYTEILENPEIQYSAMNLVNDLLRIQAPVYWCSENITLLSKDLNETGEPAPQSYGVGTFIVPFTGDQLLDTKITVIIYDYNLSHELQKKDQTTVKVHMLFQHLDICNTYELSEPKIAYFFGEGVSTRALNWYLFTMGNAGFLNSEFLDDTDVLTDLNNQDFNVFIWPGGSIIDDFNSDISIVIRLLRQHTIKQFVVNGGGFVGSCYGAFAAASGMRIFPFMLPTYYFPRLPKLGFLSIQDCLLAQAIPSIVNISLNDVDTPILFGLNKTLYGSPIRGGPVYTWLGKNTKSLATVQEVDTSWLSYFLGGDNKILQRFLKRWIRFTEGKTIWTTTEYEKGKVVTFGDHPELGDIALQRVIHNSMFYVSSTFSENINTNTSYSTKDIIVLGKTSYNLTFIENSTGLFSNVFEKINENINSFNTLLQNYSSINILLENLVHANEMDEDISFQMRIRGLWQFNESVFTSKRYLDSPQNEKNTKKYLEQLDVICTMVLLLNTSILEYISQLNEQLLQQLDEITEDVRRLSDEIFNLKDELQNYINSENQNDRILTLCGNLKKYSRTLDKHCPEINYKTRRLLKDTWYIYEAVYVSGDRSN